MNGEAAASILAVDDKPDNLNLLCRILKDGGHRVRPVPSGPLAVIAALADPPDLVLLDISMPEMNGIEVCARFKAEPRLAEIPVIFLTAHTDLSEKVRAFAAGGVDYVTKPFQTEEIHARIAAHVELRRQKRRLQESYERLAQLERMRDSLVHMIVHDLRSPMTAVGMGLEFLHADEPGLSAESKQILVQSLASIRRMTEMVTTVLDVSKIESAAMKLDLAPCDLFEVARTVEADTRPLAADRRVVLRRSDAAAHATADARLISRVLWNLVTNALRFTPRGESVFVDVDVASEEDAVRVAVTDRGRGVPAELRTTIFEKFGAVQQPGARGYSTGLGLAFCRMAVEAHGGAIDVEPGPGGVGSTFWFTLPRRTSATGAA